MSNEVDEVDEVVHFSNWASQPNVGIACTGDRGFAWTPGGFPPNIFQADMANNVKVKYTFNVDLVTCPECIKHPSYISDKENIEAFNKKLKDSGLTYEEYHEKELQKLKKLIETSNKNKPA